MIKIKNNIFNENRIVQMCINEKNNLEIDTDNGFPIVIKNATFDDIEWNYVDKVHNDKLEKAYKKVHDELVYIAGLQRDGLKTKIEQSCKIQELEEENNKLKEKINLAENILYDYLYKDKKITEELYLKYKGEENERSIYKK